MAEQRRRFAVGGEHAAAAVVAQDEIADRAGERRIAFGAADGGAPAGAAGARAGDQMQRRIGRGRRGDGGEPQTAERRRGGAESPAAQQRDQKQQRDREQIGEAQQRGRIGDRRFERQQHQPAEAHLRRKPRADDDDAGEQRQREQRNELRLDEIAGAGEVNDRRQRQQQPGEGADLPQRIRADGGEIARNESGDENDRRQPGEDEQLVASAIGGAGSSVRMDESRDASTRAGERKLQPRPPRTSGIDSTPGGRSQPPLKSTLRRTNASRAERAARREAKVLPPDMVDGQLTSLRLPSGCRDRSNASDFRRRTATRTR